uniref:RING-type E3 ubiquitin transferase n=1 Tax=Fagus sylvatica TaxID=28930 RepID=A0A2N9ECZ7_FAGSY
MWSVDHVVVSCESSCACNLRNKLLSILALEDLVMEDNQDMIYVAVGVDVKECKSIILWAVQNSGGKRICILHVHQPPQLIPFMGAKVPASSLKEKIVRDHQELERQEMQKIMDEYLQICHKMGVRAQKVYSEKDCIEKGIIELISLHGIRKLVMGAAGEKHFKKKMMDLKSCKAKYVREKAPISCHIQFICKGNLIYTRESSVGIEAGKANHLRSRSVALAKSRDITEPGQPNYLRSQSVILGHNRDNSGRSIIDIPFPQGMEEIPSLKSRLAAEGSSADEWDGTSRRSPSVYSKWDGISVMDGNLDNTFYKQLLQAMTEAEKETKRRWKAERDLFEAIRRIWRGEKEWSVGCWDRRRKFQIWRGEKENGVSHGVLGSVGKRDRWRGESENGVGCCLWRRWDRRRGRPAEESGEREKSEVVPPTQVGGIPPTWAQEELIQRKEIEEVLGKEKQELEKVKNHRDRVMEELWISQEDKTLLKSQIAELQKERDELMMERDNALKEAEGLRRKQAEASKHMPQFFSEFLLSEIEEATQGFHESLKIGQGGFGIIYKGLLRQTEVAIKRLQSQGSQGPSEFQMEVRVLSQLRHANLVKLIGSCPEVFALIYEYLPNGSLEDRLSCKDNSPPLSWQTRIRIATELCSVLVYLHCSRPHNIVHGDLKPSNILLDSNFVSKLSDFGICHQPSLIANDVKLALDERKLKSLLDPSAGDWPFEVAQELACLALRCCAKKRKNRPDLGSDVRKVLEPMRALCGASSSS